MHRSYRYCRQLNARHGKTFFLATRLLAPDQRPAVHALYGFARRADDILDEFDPRRGTAERAQELDALAGHFRERRATADAVLPAVVDTADRYGIPAVLFDAFLASMRMDLSVDRIEDSDFAVFDRRATVPNRRRAQVGITGLVKAWWARRVDR
nr:squalene/phytoene synthase family protein [Nocardia abscessus]